MFCSRPPRPPPPDPNPTSPPPLQLTASVRLGVALGILLMALMALCQSARLAVSIGFIMRVAAAGVPDSQALLAQALLFMRRSSLYFAIALRFLYAWSRERCSCLPSCPAVLLAAQVFWGGGRGLACCPHEHTKACPLAYSHPLSCPAPSPRSPAFILYAILGVCVCGWVCVGGGGGSGGCWGVPWRPDVGSQGSLQVQRPSSCAHVLREAPVAMLWTWVPAACLLACVLAFLPAFLTLLLACLPARPPACRPHCASDWYRAGTGGYAVV